MSQSIDLELESGAKTDLHDEEIFTRKTPKVQKKKRWNKDAVFGLTAALIPLVGFVIFSGFPIIISFVVMFCDMDYYDLSTITWNNFATFQQVFTDSRFYHSIGITLWVASAQFVSLGIALAVSVLLSKKVWGSKIFQILFFIPYICSSVAVSIMWIWMFNDDYGIINDILVRLFGEAARVQWFNDSSAFTWMIFIVTVWQAPGYGIVMYKAALAGVNPTLYEAAKVDGANSWTQFVKITLPAIAPTTFYLLMAGVVQGMISFTVPKLFAPTTWVGDAGVDDMGLTLVYYAYIRGMTYHDMPAASVISWAVFVVTFAISAVLFRIRNKRQKESDL